MPDIINGLFEVGGGIFLLINVRRLQLDKAVKGVHLVPTAFFAAWGYWNLFYYWNLSQWYSWCGGVFLVAVNTWWLTLMWAYRPREERNRE